MTTTIWTVRRNTPEFNDNNGLDRFSSSEKHVIDQTKAWAETLRSVAIDTSLSSVDTRSDLMIQQTWMQLERDIHTFDWFLLVLDKLLEEIEDTKSWTSKKWLSKAWKKTMDGSKAKLKQYKKQLEGKRKALLKQTNPQITDYDITKVMDIRDQINKIREDIGMWQWGEYSSIASYLCNSPENIRKAKKYQGDSLEFNQRVEQELKNAAIQNIFLRQSINAKDFYRRIAEWRYDEADYQLYIVNSSILSSSFQRCGITIPTRPSSEWIVQLSRQSGNWWKAEVTQKNPRWSADYSNMDWWDTLQKWWVAGVLDKMLSNCGNMTPWQRETWKTLWVLGCFAGWIYWLYKFYTSDKLWFWSKAWITAWAIFWSQALTWEWPLSLFNKFMTGGLSMDELKNKFGNVVWWIASSDNAGVMWWESWNGSGGEASPDGSTESVTETIVPAMYSLMIFNASTKVSDIDNMTRDFADNEKWKVFYQQACQKLEKEYGKEARDSFQVTFSDQFDEKKWKNWLAEFGITDSTDRKESIYWLSNNAIMNKTILEKFKADNWLKEIWNKDLDDYIKRKKVNNQPIDVDDLDEHKTDWFVEKEDATNTHRPEDVENRTTLENQVKALSLDKAQKEELVQAIKSFYDERAIKNKPDMNDFSLKIEKGLLVLKSHGWYETKIDIATRTLKSWKTGVDMTFPTLSEVLDAADLTNYILQLTYKKTPVNFPIFTYHIVPQKAICFNDNAGRLDLFDTAILDVNRIRNRSTIDKNPSAYANYLSECRKDVNRLNLDKYPLVKKLWIGFYSSEDEVKKLEIRLKWVKNEVSKLESWKDTNIPFSISKSVLWGGVELNFLSQKALHQKSKVTVSSVDIFKEFPTLNWDWNEKLLIDALNDEKNWMYVKGK